MVFFCILNFIYGDFYDLLGIFSIFNPHFCWGEDGDLKDFSGNFHICSTSNFFWGKMNHFSLFSLIEMEMVVSTKSGEDFTFFFFSMFFCMAFLSDRWRLNFMLLLDTGIPSRKLTLRIQTPPQNRIGTPNPILKLGMDRGNPGFLGHTDQILRVTYPTLEKRKSSSTVPW